MARTVTDAVILFNTIAGRDKDDKASNVVGKFVEKDYTKFLDADGLRGARLGLVMQYTTKPELKEYAQKYIQVLRDAGATLAEVTFAPDYSKLSDDRLNVLEYEFKTDLAKYLTARGAKYKSLDDLIKFNEENKEKEMPKFAQELFEQSRDKGELSDKSYIDSLAKINKSTREEGIDAVIAKDKLDALVCLTSGVTWSIAAVGGYPYITVPLGLRENTAMGMAFFGRAYSEPSLIKYAFAFEQKTKGRVTPQFLSTYKKK
jgi:amidase